MDFTDLEIRPGRPQRHLEARIVREIVNEDLVLLATEPRHVQAPALKRIGQRHHALARLLASGMKPGEAATALGYDPSRVSILQADPTFAELITFYRTEVNNRYMDAHMVLSGIMGDAALELSERLEEDPKKISTHTLIRMVEMGADRTGFGPTTRQEVNVNVNVASRLENARKRVAKAQLELQALPEPINEALKELETLERKEKPPTGVHLSHWRPKDE
jgi:hypothetical protein